MDFVYHPSINFRYRVRCIHDNMRNDMLKVPGRNIEVMRRPISAGNVNEINSFGGNYCFVVQFNKEKTEETKTDDKGKIVIIKKSGEEIKRIEEARAIDKKLQEVLDGPSDVCLPYLTFDEARILGRSLSLETSMLRLPTENEYEEIFKLPGLETIKDSWEYTCGHSIPDETIANRPVLLSFFNKNNLVSSWTVRDPRFYVRFVRVDVKPFRLKFSDIWRFIEHRSQAELDVENAMFAEIIANATKGKKYQ